jgi:hypothetical protein
MNDLIKQLEKNGFIKIRNKEEYLQVVPILEENGYSFVGDEFPINSTPFDASYRSSNKDRKNSIYLVLSLDDDRQDKFLWLADYLDKNRISDRFPVGTPDSY